MIFLVLFSVFSVLSTILSVMFLCKLCVFQFFGHSSEFTFNLIKIGKLKHLTVCDIVVTRCFFFLKFFFFEDSKIE